MMDRDHVTIRGLTFDQIELLDQMWAIDTADELEAYMLKQPPEVRHKIRVLQEMLHLSYSDSMVEQMEEYPDAKRLLENIFK